MTIEMESADPRLAAFDYDLPEGLIARFPPKQRDGGRLLCSTGASWKGMNVTDLVDCFRAGDVLVVNDTRVLRARMHGRRQTGGRVEFLLLESDGSSATAMVRPSKKIADGEVVALTNPDGSESGEWIRVDGRLPGGARRLQLSLPANQLMDLVGSVPLPPYLDRAAQTLDLERYQTVFAEESGAVAAPTASLHLTHDMLGLMRDKGVKIQRLTLHVGAGTFRNLRPSDLDSGELHTERYRIPQATADEVNRAKAEGRTVAAVGTTVTRALESATGEDGRLMVGDSTTKLFIRPGYQFRTVNRLMTNFHLPKSSLLMLACAFGGRDHVLAGYAKAIDLGFRFYSYGDAMLLGSSVGVQ